MLASTAIPPLIVMIQVYLCPESPRWYIGRNRYTDAFKSFCRLRASPLQAARDLYYADKQIAVEMAEKRGRNLFSEVIHNRRVRRGAQSAFFVMFMQQFCGVNVIAYYSTAVSLFTILSQATESAFKSSTEPPPTNRNDTCHN